MKNLRSKLIRLTPSLVLLLLWSCNDGKLSNLEAEKQLKNNYPRYLTTTIQLNDNSLSPIIPNELKLLSDRELASYTFIPPGVHGYGCYGVLSEEAKQYIVRQISYEFVEMAIAKVEVEKVTGIREVPAMNVSEVEYTEKIVAVTPIGEIISGINIGQINNVTATFNKYNDGWRIADFTTSAKKITISDNYVKENTLNKETKGINDSNLDLYNTQYYKTIQIKNGIDSLSYSFGIINYNSWDNIKLSISLKPMILANAMVDEDNGKAMMSDEAARVFIITKGKSTQSSNQGSSNVVHSSGNKLFVEKVRNKEDSLSYAFGIVNFNNLKTDSLKLDPVIIAKAMIDEMNEKPLMSDKGARSYFLAFINHREAKRALRKAQVNKEVYNDYIVRNEEFLISNASKPNVIVTTSGLQYEVIHMGTGSKPSAKSTVKVHYVGTLIDGSEFDSSVKRNQPATFPVSGVIPGWTEGLQLMPVGSKFKLYLPQNLAYGATGAGDVIKPFSTLIFEVELLEIVK